MKTPVFFTRGQIFDADGEKVCNVCNGQDGVNLAVMINTGAEVLTPDFGKRIEWILNAIKNAPGHNCSGELSYAKAE